MVQERHDECDPVQFHCGKWYLHFSGGLFRSVFCLFVCFAAYLKNVLLHLCPKNIIGVNQMVLQRTIVQPVHRQISLISTFPSLFFNNLNRRVKIITFIYI